MSIVLRPDRTLKEGLLITTAAATAVYRAVKKICGIDLGIKWVNDLYLHDRKVCGILTGCIVWKQEGCRTCKLQYSCGGDCQSASYGSGNSGTFQRIYRK